MDRYFKDLYNVEKINCQINLLKESFLIHPSIYGHWIFDSKLDKWLSQQFIQLLDRANIIPKRIEIFHTEPFRTTGWHTDMNPPKDYVKINWVFEEGISFMEWGVANDLQNGILKETIADTQYVSFDPRTVKTEIRKNLVGPTLVNVGVPHRIINNKETERWCLSCIIVHKHTHQRITWNEAIKIFSDYF